MSIFVIFRVKKPDLLGEAVRNQFPHDHYELQENEWLVSANLTTREVSDKLQISEGDNGSAIVFKMSSYFGRTQPDIWEWIKTKSEAQDG